MYWVVASLVFSVTTLVVSVWIFLWCWRLERRATHLHKEIADAQRSPR